AKLKLLRQKRRSPDQEDGRNKICADESEHQRDSGRRGENGGKCFPWADRRTFRIVSRVRFGLAAPRFVEKAEQHNCHEHSGGAEKEESRAPAELLGEPASEPAAGDGAGVHA